MNDTFPKYLIYNAQRFADRPAIREKDLGIWQTWTWRQMKDEVFALANGLASIGFGRGDKLAIIGANRPRLYWGIAAAQSLGGIPVPIYADSVAVEMKYVLNHAEVSFVLAEDQEQVDKAIEIKPDCPSLKQVIFDDPRGLRDYDRTALHDFRDIQQAGRELAKINPEPGARDRISESSFIPPVPRAIPRVWSSAMTTY
jgi:long-chain acyl-CoA synthetase